jgi:hypothetical protein
MVDATPEIKMRLLRHTSLKTTTTYLRRVDERMEQAVERLGMSEKVNTLTFVRQSCSPMAAKNAPKTPTKRHLDN